MLKLRENSIAAFAWKDSAATSRFIAGVCLHGHTPHSEECLPFLLRYLHRAPVVSQMVSSYERGPRRTLRQTSEEPPAQPGPAASLERVTQERTRCDARRRKVQERPQIRMARPGRARAHQESACGPRRLASAHPSPVCRRKPSLVFAIGLVFGVFPVYGVPTTLCAAVAIVFRLKN
jgi:hypothetical protein